MSVILFILGACIGSFLNVCIYRIPEGISIVAPRSRCGSCGRELGPIDMIPILSYFILGGKCRRCKAQFSVRYALIEALTGIIFVLAYWKFGYTITLLFVLNLISLLIVVFFIDLDHMIIPNALVVYGLITGALLLCFHAVAGASIYSIYGYTKPVDGIFGMVIGSGILLILWEITAFLSKGKPAIGMGDVKIYLPIGLFLGLRLTLFSLWFAFVIGGIVGLFMILGLKADKKTAMPFGPFIVIGSIVSILYGDVILRFIMN